ncbi:uncharacterized protein LOC126674621 isoform X2 [Mercurialis annua]|uniref:uncharacterized protein LOC126674621 isoform X2 n=1 Tax=Mercurialis annua TaxID=3986 RepID=UPI00215EF884|nr:uncharacterized protein LOC126674621 isoform X2 [Mercurialis annua]
MSSSTDEERRHPDYDEVEKLIQHLRLPRGTPHVVCFAEDSDVDFDRFPVPRCVDSLQNLSLFNNFEERICDTKPLCKAPHKHEVDYGPRVMDFYSIIIKRKKGMGCSLKGRINGFIEINWEPDVCVFKVKREDADAEWVELSPDQERHTTITLYGPVDNGTRLYMCDSGSGVGAALALDDQPLVQCDDPHLHCYEDDQVFGRGNKVGKVFGRGNKVGRACFTVHYQWTQTPYISNRLLESRLDPGNENYVPLKSVSPWQIFLQYAIMRPGLVAKITIKIIDHGDVAHVSGSIYARPCCFSHQIPLINKTTETMVNADGEIQLKRSIVAVPAHASLVIAADNLLDNHGNSVADHAITFFIPAEKGSYHKIMSRRTESWHHTGDARLQVEVEWIPHQYGLFKKRSPSLAQAATSEIVVSATSEGNTSGEEKQDETDGFVYW